MKLPIYLIMWVKIMNKTKLKQTKVCRLCLEEKPIFYFKDHKSSRDGKTNCCIPCKEMFLVLNKGLTQSERRDLLHKKYVEYHKLIGKNYYWRIPDPKKLKAHKAVAKAVREGLIERGTCCEVCGSTEKIHGHHWSYEEINHLQVYWLCKSCHYKHHRGQLALPPYKLKNYAELVA